MIVSLVFLGISQSLITLGVHAYLVKGIRVKDGDAEDYPFTINSIYDLSRLRSEGMMFGAFIGSIGFCVGM